MARNYYTLVAGLREYSLESDTKGFDAPAIIAEIREELGGKDRDYLRLFLGYYDIENIINILAGRSRHSELGNYTRGELEAEVKNPENLPGYMAGVLRAYAEPDNPEYDDTDRTKTIEKALLTAFYAECTRSKNKFIRKWYDFDRNLRNLLAAYAARRAELVIADELVGDDYVADMLARSSAADFGLQGELDYIDEVATAVQQYDDLLGKERRLDLVRWNMAGALTESDYFDMNAILAYVVKVALVYRWMSLDQQTGREMFRKLVESFSAGDALVDRE